MIVLLLFVLVVGALVLGTAVWNRRSPDTDLDGWQLGDPMPGARRRPCLDESCRIDHDAVNPWMADRAR